MLLEALAQGKAVSPVADKDMISVLKRQKFNDGIPAGVPAGITVAHKTGSITRIQHDAGIVYAARPYTLVILVRGIDDETKSKALIAQLSKIVFTSVR